MWIVKKRATELKIYNKIDCIAPAYVRVIRYFSTGLVSSGSIEIHIRITVATINQHTKKFTRNTSHCIVFFFFFLLSWMLLIAEKMKWLINFALDCVQFNYYLIFACQFWKLVPSKWKMSGILPLTFSQKHH